MNFDGIIDFLHQWTLTFSWFIDQFSVRIGDLIGEDSLWTVILPNTIKDTTLFGLMFATLFGTFVAITIWKWAKQTIL